MTSDAPSFKKARPALPAAPFFGAARGGYFGKIFPPPDVFHMLTAIPQTAPYLRIDQREKKPVESKRSLSDA
jgi:hypothetical protein